MPISRRNSPLSKGISSPARATRPSSVGRTPRRKRFAIQLGIPGGFGLLLKDDPSATVVGLDRFRPEDSPPPGRSVHDLSADGRRGHVSDCALGDRRLLPLARDALRKTVAALVVRGHHRPGAGGESRRVGGRRSRPAALGRLSALQWTGGSPGEGDLVTGPDGFVQYDPAAGLRTENAVSRAVTGQQVLSSIIGFGLVYALLLVIWFRVLHHKIQEGPDLPEAGQSANGRAEGFLRCRHRAADEGRHHDSRTRSTGRLRRPEEARRWTDLLPAAAAAGPFGENPLTREFLVIVWFLLLGVLLAGYAILDGFDLGVGILHLFVPKDETERRLAINAIGPLWDGNEVWLVTFGGAMFAMFPYAYATLFSGFYTASCFCLVMLIFRAASIEMRGKMTTLVGRRAWDYAFFAASLGAAFLFGVAAGNVVLGVPLDQRGTMTSGILDQLNPYALLTGATTVSVFAMHGGIYLHLKTEGEFQARLERVVWTCFGLFLTSS